MTYNIDQLKAMDAVAISKCSSKHIESVIAELIETARHAATAEREACAQLAQWTPDPLGLSQKIAAAIRARGQEASNAR